MTGLVWIDAFRSLGEQTPASPEEVVEFVAPFRADFAGAVDGFARNMFPTTADPDLVGRVAAEMASAHKKPRSARWATR